MSPTKIAPVYVVRSGELQIEATVAQTWPVMLDYPAWQNYGTVETIEGTPGEPGELVRLVKEEEGFVFPPYFARTIAIEPGKKVIWKTFLDEEAAEVPGFGIVEFRLSEREGTTTFWYNLIYEFLVPYETAEDLTAFQAAQEENFRNLTASTHPRLKEQAEGVAAAERGVR